MNTGVAKILIAEASNYPISNQYGCHDYRKLYVHDKRAPNELKCCFGFYNRFRFNRVSSLASVNIGDSSGFIATSGNHYTDLLLRVRCPYLRAMNLSPKIERVCTLTIY